MEATSKHGRFFSSIRNFSFSKSNSGDSTSSNDTISPPRSAGENPATNTSRRRRSQGQAYLHAMAEVKVLVYHYRAERNPIVPNGLAVITHRELKDILAANPMLQLSKKPIPPLSHSINIYQSDLHTTSQDVAEPAGTHPNDGSNIACVTFPMSIATRILLGKHKELYIVSPKTS